MSDDGTPGETADEASETAESNPSAASTATPPPYDVTVAAVGTSLTWCTGNYYQAKFPDLVHRDLNGDYPLDEKYLHWNPSEGEPPSPRHPYGDPDDPDYPHAKESDHPNPSYYEQTVADGYDGKNPEHPRGPHLPPSQYRARGGAIIGLDWPAKVLFGDTDPSEVSGDDDGNYLAENSDGDYDGKLDGLGQYATLDSRFRNLFDDQGLNRSAWLLMRDIGWGWPTIPDQIDQFDGGTSWQSPADVPVDTADGLSANPDRMQPGYFTHQFASSPPPGEDVDVVILDGGTNDMQLGWLNNPTKAGRTEIRDAAETYMYYHMTGEAVDRTFGGNDDDPVAGLLERARETFPNAVIVLIGEPVWTSNRTDYDNAEGFYQAVSWKAGLPGVPESAIDNALTFSHVQAHYLRRAVAEQSLVDDGPGIVFAPPGYGVINSAMADWPWSFGAVKESKFQPVHTVDDTYEDRKPLCDAETAWESRNDDERSELNQLSCNATAIGHPNNEGCRQYADTIVRRYKEYVDLSLRSVSENLDGGEDSLRRSLRRYGLDEAGGGGPSTPGNRDFGVRWGASQRTVDAMQADVETGGEALARGRPYLGVRPGRRPGDDPERFAMDTERPFGVADPSNVTDDFRPNTTERFFFDPMMRKRITGPVGNVDGPEVALSQSVDEEDEQTLHSKGHWSDRRLELGDVDHLTLVVRGVEGNGWAAEAVDYELNGSLEGRRDLAADFDESDFRSTLRSREFQVASFNGVDGVSASDLTITTIGTDFDGGISGPAMYELSVGVDNPTGERVPSVLVQYGWEVDGEGRDWQVVELGAIPSGESRSADVDLRAKQDLAFRTKQITIRVGVFVGNTAQWTATTTDRGDLSDL